MSALAANETSLVPRLLAGIRRDRPLSLAEHLAQHGALQAARASSLTDVIEASGLQGRGGAAFPVAQKLAAVGAQPGRPVVVVNATEGEPLSGKDKVLLRHVPHLVLDGAVALALEVGTNDVVIAVSQTAQVERNVLDTAIAERRARRFERRVDVHVATVPDRFVAGEETALVHYLNGGPPTPTTVPPRPFEHGVDGRPTLVQNVETVAQVALIARYGASWFRRVGTRGEPGTALFTVSGAVRRPGVHEAELGIPLHELVELSGGVTKAPQAFLVGGYFGTWFTAADARTLTLEDACLGAWGGGLGARAIVVLPEAACGLAETARVSRFLADESAGQCGPCVHGLSAIAATLERATTIQGGDERDRLTRWCTQLLGRGACRHPDGAVRFVASAMVAFADEFEAHCVHRRCNRSGVKVLPIPSRRR